MMWTKCLYTPVSTWSLDMFEVTWSLHSVHTIELPILSWYGLKAFILCMPAVLRMKSVSAVTLWVTLIIYRFVCSLFHCEYIQWNKLHTNLIKWVHFVEYHKLKIMGFKRPLKTAANTASLTPIGSWFQSCRHMTWIVTVLHFNCGMANFVVHKVSVELCSLFRMSSILPSNVLRE